MDQTHLRKLKREQLLELMLQQQEQIELLETRVHDLEQALEQKEIKLEQSGSIAEAALALNQIFEAAQAAADQYLLSIKASQKKES